jgi:hypothetical protein
VPSVSGGTGRVANVGWSQMTGAPGASSIGAAVGRARRYALSVSIPEIKESGWSWLPCRVALAAVEQLGAVAVDWGATYWSAGAP